jgi:hypothetical protein
MIWILTLVILLTTPPAQTDPPFFVSTPGIEANGVYTYYGTVEGTNVTVTLLAGREWLTLTDLGNGHFVLESRPGVTLQGVTATLQAQDQAGGRAIQSFTID